VEMRSEHRSTIFVAMLVSCGSAFSSLIPLMSGWTVALCLNTLTRSPFQPYPNNGCFRTSLRPLSVLYVIPILRDRPKPRTTFARFAGDKSGANHHARM
jgi:hypothetical protein